MQDRLSLNDHWPHIGLPLKHPSWLGDPDPGKPAIHGSKGEVVQADLCLLGGWCWRHWRVISLLICFALWYHSYPWSCNVLQVISLAISHCFSRPSKFYCCWQSCTNLLCQLRQVNSYRCSQKTIFQYALSLCSKGKIWTNINKL